MHPVCRQMATAARDYFRVGARGAGIGFRRGEILFIDAHGTSATNAYIFDHAAQTACCACPKAGACRACELRASPIISAQNDVPSAVAHTPQCRRTGCVVFRKKSFGGNVRPGFIARVCANVSFAIHRQSQNSAQSMPDQRDTQRSRAAHRSSRGPCRL